MINNKLYYGGVIVIWLYLLIPVVIIGGIAVYLEKKSGMTPPDEKLGEIFNQNGINSNGTGTDYFN